MKKNRPDTLRGGDSQKSSASGTGRGLRGGGGGELGFLHLLLLSKEIYCPLPKDSCISEVISNSKARGLSILELRPRVLGREIGECIVEQSQPLHPNPEWRPHLYVGRGASKDRPCWCLQGIVRGRALGPESGRQTTRGPRLVGARDLGVGGFNAS